MSTLPKRTELGDKKMEPLELAQRCERKATGADIHDVRSLTPTWMWANSKNDSARIAVYGDILRGYLSGRYQTIREGRLANREALIGFGYKL
jgi:hypothetical protein